MKSIIAMIVLSIISSCISKERGNQEAEAYSTLDTIKFIDVKTYNISSQCSSVIGGEAYP